MKKSKLLFFLLIAFFTSIILSNFIYCSTLYSQVFLVDKTFNINIKTAHINSQEETNYVSQISKKKLQAPIIISPKRGAIISDLRPIIELAPVSGVELYTIEISPEPNFLSNNVIAYTNGNVIGDKWQARFGSRTATRFSGLSKKYERYEDKFNQPNRWKVPYNLTAMVNSPYGYRIIPCRDWLSFFAQRLSEGTDDPVLAIHNFVAFGINNEGGTSEYYDAYGMLSRNEGVCGNTAELTVALAAAHGFKSRILSLKGSHTGHVVAEVQRKNGKWVFSDALYNVKVEKSIQDILQEVKSNPNFLDIAPFDGSFLKYRNLLESTNYAYKTETSSQGIKFTDKVKENEGMNFPDLKYSCSPDMERELNEQKKIRISNIFFIRSSYYKNGEWSEFSKSYFIFRPSLNKGEKYDDNAKDIWLDGKLVPKEFMNNIPSS